MQFARALVSAFIGATGVLAAVQFVIELADHRTIDLLVIAYFIGWTAAALTAEMFVLTGGLLVIVAVVSAIAHRKPGDKVGIYLPFTLGFVGSIAICAWLIATGSADYDDVSAGDRQFATWAGIGVLVLVVAFAPKALSRSDRQP